MSPDQRAKLRKEMEAAYTAEAERAEPLKPGG